MVSGPSSTEMIQRDLRKIMAELGMSLHARNASPHDVVIHEVLPRIRQVKAAQPDRPEPVDPASVERAWDEGYSVGIVSEPGGGDKWQVVPKSGATPPLYLLDDLWQALGGDPTDFDDWHNRHGATDTWGQLLHIVRRTFRPVCGKPVDGEYCVLTAPNHESDMHICHGPSDVGKDELPPIPAAQPDRGEPVDPASVRVGDVVEVEADDGSWMVRGKCWSPLNDNCIGLSTDHGCYFEIHYATVRILQRDEDEPHPAHVEVLGTSVHTALAAVGPPGENDDWRKWSDRVAYLLAREGVTP